MRWNLEISDQELIDQIGTILFTVLLPNERSDIFANIQEQIIAGKFLYTAEEIKDDIIIMNIIEHPDVAKFNLTDNTFKNTLCLKINPTTINNSFFVLYDKDNYLFLFKIDEHIYKFNFGFYLMLININTYAQAAGLGNIVDNIDTEKLLESKKNNKLEDSDCTDSNLVM